MSLRDLEAADDTRTLLERLRNRRDLFAAIAAEIDDLLGSPTRAPVFSFTLPKPPPKMDTPQHTDTRPSHTATHVMSLRERLLGACAGAAVGVVLGAITGSFSPNPADLPVVAFTYVINGAITGAISGRHGRVIIIALAGLVLGFIIWLTVYGFAAPAILMAPIGAILGAIVGDIIKKKKGWT